jgi:hypothetical protein
MTDPVIQIRFDGNGRAHHPGEILAGEFRIDGIDANEIRSVEISVLWFTEGKGEEDLSVHDFWRLSADDGDVIDPRQPSRFSTVLPNSPLSYRGVVFQLHWCVRVRVFTTHGREIVGEMPFRLGDVRAAKPVTT